MTGPVRPAGRIVVVAAAIALVALDVHLIGPYVRAATAALGHPVPGWVALALGSEIVSMLAAACLQRRMLRVSGTQLRMPTAIGLAYSAYAMSMSLPAGSAMSAGYTFRRLRQLGAAIPVAGFTMISTNVLNILSYGLLALAGFVVAGGASGGLAAALLGLLAGVALVLVTKTLLGRPELLERVAVHALHLVNRVLHRDTDAGVPQVHDLAVTLCEIHPRKRDWAAGLIAALVNWVADLGCLYAACQALGASHATVGVVLLAYLAGTSVSGISLVPGGLGVVDAALIGVLVGQGVGTVQAAAAVVLYRGLSFGFGAVGGWGVWLVQTRTVRTAGDRGASPGAVPPPVVPTGRQDADPGERADLALRAEPVEQGAHTEADQLRHLGAGGVGVAVGRGR